MKISQKRAIWYAIQKKKEELAERIIKELKESGIQIKISKYPEVTLRRAKQALKENIKGE